MAKKDKKINKYASGLFLRTEQYADKVRHHYSTAVEELLKISANAKIDPSEAFSFKDNKKLSNKVNGILRGLYSAVYNEIKNGVEAEWEYANLSCDALIESIFGKGLKENNHFARWFSRNQEAMDAFFKRKSKYGGLNLSQRVWKYSEDLKTEMELALSLSLGQGDSASTVSRKVRQYLQHPDKLFRRIKVGVDSEGNPLYKLSKAAKAYHPGRGVYRSSYKNAMRLTRTETNMAYRASEQDRWKRMDFVVGYEITRSKRKFDCSICESLKGKYPKDFVFNGWHPQCRCVVLPILATEDEFIKVQKDILDGKESTLRSVNQIRKPHDGFYKWWEDNKWRVESATAMPYWVQDNQDYINKKKKIRVKTDEEREAIRLKWAERAKKHQLVTKMASNVLKVAQEYPEIDLTALEKYASDKNIVAMEAEARRVAKLVSEERKEEKTLEVLIPNVHTLHKTYSIKRLKQIHGELDDVFKNWLAKYSYSNLGEAPLIHLKNKLEFELSNLSRYSNEELVKDILKEHIRIVDRKIKWNDLTTKAAKLDSFKTKSPKYKKLLSKIDDAISRNDFEGLEKTIAEAEVLQGRLNNKKIKRKGDVAGALNSEYKGSVEGQDITASIDVSKMTSEDPYGGTFTNNIARLQGFDSPAKLVTQKEFDELSSSCGDVFYRTLNPAKFKGKNMSGEEFASQMYIADKLELNGPGGRVYGDGIYVATSAWNGRRVVALSEISKEEALWESASYGYGSHKTLEMTWLRPPKIIKQEDLREMWANLSSSQRGKFGNNENTYACALGYDAMYCDGPRYMVIWNRSIIAVCNK